MTYITEEQKARTIYRDALYQSEGTDRFREYFSLTESMDTRETQIRLRIARRAVDRAGFVEYSIFTPEQLFEAFGKPVTEKDNEGMKLAFSIATIFRHKN